MARTEGGEEGLEWGASNRSHRLKTFGAGFVKFAHERGRRSEIMGESFRRRAPFEDSLSYYRGVFIECGKSVVHFMK